VVRLTDLIRGTKSLEEEEKEKKAKAAAAPPAPPPASAPPAPPIELRTLREQVRPEIPPSHVPSTPVSPPPVQAPVQLRALVTEEVRPAPGIPAQPVASAQSVAPVLNAPPEAFSSSQEVIDWYGRAEGSLVTIAALIRKQSRFSLGDLPEIAAGMVASLEKDEHLLVRAISHQSGPSLIGNMVHSAIFAIKIGKGMGYRPDELDRLGLAALVHDLGMFRLPEQLLDQQGRWSREQIELMQRHPTVGADLLKQAAQDRPWLPEVVEQEHERIDGSGYPRKLQGPQIQEFALIIGLVDTLDAMLRSRLSRKALLPYEAVRLLLSREKSKFPTKVFKSLLQEFSLFPVGTWVKLTTGEIGEVVRSNPRFPIRPAVKIVIDQSGQRLRTPRELDLGGSPLIHVSEIVDRM
jgi:HD-GYP domain-containing protein (c-di-GMP phosphodiesterase class II)